jgi:hypothetical protein
MSKHRISFTFVFLVHILLGIVNTSANDELADLESLFTPNVTIIDYTLSPSNTGVRFDNATRVLIIDDNRYPYPAQILQSIGRYSHRQNQLFLEVTETLPDADEVRNRSRSWVWSFDLRTEAFSRVRPLCNTPSRLSLSEIKARWIYVTDPVTGQARLCETASGIKSEPLPKAFSWEVQPPFSTDPLPVFDSPDGRWLLLFGERDDQIQVQSFDIQTQDLMNLGTISCSFCVEHGSVRWFGTVVQIWSWDYKAGDTAIFSANVIEANSLALAVTRSEYSPEFYDNPPRYDYVNYVTLGDFWHVECQHVIYDILSGQTQITEMGPLCRLEWGTLNGIGYYRDTTRGTDGIAALTVFNADTLETEVLYENEIEWISWVSPDNHYAAVVLDNSGHIDTPPFLDPLFSWGMPASPTFAYIDLTNDEVLYEIPTGWNSCDASLGGPNFDWSAGLSISSVQPCTGIGPTGAIFPRSDNTFLAIGNKESNPSDASFGVARQVADSVSVNDGRIIQARLLEGQLIPYTMDFVLSENSDEIEGTTKFSLIPLDGSKPIEITNAIPIDYYRQLTVTDIYPTENEVRFLIQAGAYSQVGWNTAHVTVKIAMPNH